MQELGFNHGWNEYMPCNEAKNKNKKVRHYKHYIYVLAFLFYIIHLYIYIPCVYNSIYVQTLKRQKIYYLIIKMGMVVTADWQKESFGVMKIFKIGLWC